MLAQKLWLDLLSFKNRRVSRKRFRMYSVLVWSAMQPAVHKEWWWMMPTSYSDSGGLFNEAELISFPEDRASILRPTGFLAEPPLVPRIWAPL